MKKLIPILLLFAFGCHDPNPELEAEILGLKQKLETTEKALNEASIDRTDFVHTVFFWIKEGVTEEQKTDFRKNGLTALSKIGSIYKFYAGPPAGTPREVVDNSYDFALICHFENAAAQDSYQDDPIHLKFIEDYKDLWEKVVVYDNLVEE